MTINFCNASSLASISAIPIECVGPSSSSTKRGGIFDNWSSKAMAVWKQNDK